MTNKEKVTDQSYKKLNGEPFLYESPDKGETIYRRPVDYCEVSGVKIDKSPQMEFDFYNEDSKVESLISGIHDKMTKIENLINEMHDKIKKL